MLGPFKKIRNGLRMVAAVLVFLAAALAVVVSLYGTPEASQPNVSSPSMSQQDLQLLLVPPTEVQPQPATQLQRLFDQMLAPTPATDNQQPEFATVDVPDVMHEWPQVPDVEHMHSR